MNPVGGILCDDDAASPLVRPRFQIVVIGGREWVCRPRSVRVDPPRQLRVEVVTEDVSPGGRGGWRREQAVWEGSNDRTIWCLATAVHNRAMVSEGREGVRGNVPWGP